MAGKSEFLSNQEILITKDRSWNYFLRIFASHRANLQARQPDDFYDILLRPREEIQEIQIERAANPAELLFLHDIATLGQAQVESYYQKKDEHLDFNESMVHREMDIRNGLSEIFSIDTSPESPLREAMDDPQQQLLRLHILGEQSDPHVLYLCTQLGLKINDKENIPPAKKPRLRRKWLYDKMLETYAEESLTDNALSLETYQSWRGGEVLSANQKEYFPVIQEIDQIVHQFVKQATISMQYDGRGLTITEFFRSRRGLTSVLGRKLNILSQKIKNPASDPNLKADSIIRVIAESIERISIDYCETKHHSTTDLPRSIRCVNPGIELNRGIMLTTQTREYFVQSGQLNSSYRSRMMENQRYRLNLDLEINYAKRILGSEKNFTKWLGGATPESLDTLAGGVVS